MRKVDITTVVDIARYEKTRPEFRAAIIALKKLRRVQVGPMVTFVFENRETVLSQIQEMMRAERIVDDAAIQHEIDTYNQLLPDQGQLAATMMIELPTSGNIREQMTRLYGLNQDEATFLQVGESWAPGSFDPGQSDEHRISAVQYVRFQLSPAQIEAFLNGSDEIHLVIDHRNYHHRALIPDLVRDELKNDLQEV